ncbi:MAG: DUF6161 domain-containing protein [Bacteroidota bacterium]|nr:DUF6161 domain-containing protein [Bacteroidota bacterium]
MTLTELKEKVATSPNREWLQNYELNLNYSHINFKLTLKGVVSIYEFILKQIEGFATFEKLPSELESIKNSFIFGRDRILNSLVNNNINAGQWNNDLQRIIVNSPPKFLFDFPETEFLIRLSKENAGYYLGAYEYLSGSTQHPNSKQHLIGYLLAYEFTSKDTTELAERIDSEKKSISTIRNDFQKILGDSENQMTDYLSQANQKYIDYSGKIDEFKKEKESTYSTWFENTSKSFDQFKADSDNKIKELEELYREKLKLEAPAKYWSDRAKKLRTEGYWWLGALILMVLVGIGMLIWSLSEISNGTLARIFQNSGTAIKWSVVFITLISFIAFAIRIFSKLTFSSFHLVRDAEEREQLTYVYLALQKEKGIDETERHLIMQSLFSRADTGLLKDDAGPTMPGNIVDNIIRK